MAEAVARGVRRVDEQARPIRVSVSPITIAALTLTAVALVMRLAALDRESLWLDEGYTLLFSGMPLPRLLTVGGAHEHPPLYSVLVHAGTGLWHSYLVPRVISAVAGGLSALAVYFLGDRLLSARAGLIGCALVTLSPMHLWYSQDGRAYELAGLFVLLSYLSLAHAVDGRGRIPWILYATCTLLALYTEYTTFLALMPQALFLRRSMRPLLASWAGVLIGFVPWLGILLHDAAGVAGDYWIPAPTVTSVTGTTLEFLGLLTPCPSPPCGGQELIALGGAGEGLAWLTIVGAVLAALWALRTRDLILGVLIAWLLVPFIVVLALSPVRSLYLDRVFLDVSFPLYLLIGLAVARAWSRLWNRAILMPLLAALLVAEAATSGLVYANNTNPDWRPLARDLQSAYRPGQALMLNPGVLRTLLSFYLPAGWQATRERALWSRAYLDVPGWQAYYPRAPQTDLESRTIVDTVLRYRQLADVTRGINQTWLVTMDYPGMSDVRRWFALHEFQLILSQLYPGDTRLELWSRRDPSSLGPSVVMRTFDTAWRREGHASATGGLASTPGGSGLMRSFPVRPGRAYSVGLQYLALPGAGPRAQIDVFDRQGRLLESFPHTMWYELPATGVWLSQPFGFIPPPGSARATLTLQNRRGQVQWRHVGVFTTRR